MAITQSGDLRTCLMAVCDDLNNLEQQQNVFCNGLDAQNYHRRQQASSTETFPGDIFSK